MSRLTGGQAALIARQKAGAAPSSTVTYARLAGGSIDLTGQAWVGRTVFRRSPLSEAGGSVVFGDRDYLIPASALPTDPAKGDRITETVGAAVLTFEVMAPDGEPAWRWSDPQRTLYRVHAKQVA